MKSNKESWFTLLILAIVVLFIFIKEDAFSKEKENYITYLEIYNKEVPLEQNRKEYNLTFHDINIKKLDIKEDMPICTCDVTKINYEKDKYEINISTTFDNENKKVTIIISINKIGSKNILDNYIVNINYQEEIRIEEGCQKEYSCPIL